MARREQHLEVADHLAVGEGVATRAATQRDREAAPTKRLDERARTALVVVVVMGEQHDDTRGLGAPHGVHDRVTVAGVLGPRVDDGDERAVPARSFLQGDDIRVRAAERHRAGVVAAQVSHAAGESVALIGHRFTSA